MRFNPFEDRISKRARFWSNEQLRLVSPFLKGDIVNISAWMDDDKEGGKYKAYFNQAQKYDITNYPSQNSRSGEGIPLDLEKPLPQNLMGAYDHVFNHTTLEHVYDFKMCFTNLCAMAKKSVIVVVPFSQIVHVARDNSWLDYWRFTPHSILRLYEENDFKCHYLSMNEEIGGASYIFAIGIRNNLSIEDFSGIPNTIQLKNNLGLKGKLTNLTLWLIDQCKKKR